MNQGITQISALLKAGKFTEVVSFVNSSNTQFSCYYIGLRQNLRTKGKVIGVFDDAAYWQSELSCHYIDEILSSPVKVSFLQHYFSCDKNCNPSLNVVLLSEYFDDFKRFFKLEKCHRKESFMKSLTQLSAQQTVLKLDTILKLSVFIQELETIRKAEIKSDKEERAYNEELLRLPFDKVLLGVVRFHEEWMQDINIVKNADKQTMYDFAIVKEADRIINVFLDQHDKSGLKTVFKTDADVQEEWNKIKPNHKFKTPRHIKLANEYETLNKIIGQGIKRQIIEFAINAYLSGYGDFIDPYNIDTIKFNDAFARYSKNDYKSRFEELYFYHPYISDLLTKRTQVGSLAIADILKFYNIPVEFTPNKGGTFNFTRAYSLLDTFSNYKSPVGEMFAKIGHDIIPMIKLNEPSESFKELFGSNEHISVFNKKVLLDGITGYFGYTAAQSEELLQSLSINIQHDKGFKSMLQNPFIIFGEKVYWLGRLCKNRRWDVLLRNKLKQNGFLPENIKRNIGEGLEAAVHNLFKDAGYNVLHGKEHRDFKLFSGEKGELDLMAYKDGEIIIGEIKSGITTEEPDAVNETETIRLEGCAAEQLEKVNAYLKEAWDATLRQCFRSDKNYNELKIVSLIITDFFEGDCKLFKNTYHKTSLLELEVILKNQKRRLYESGVMLSVINRNNPAYKMQPEIIEYDLWNGQSYFSASILQECIENNRVWKEIEEMRTF